MTSARQLDASRSMQIAWLALPMAALLALGVHFMARDRRWVEQEARERADQIVRTILGSVHRSATNVAVAEYLSATNAWPKGTALVTLEADGQLAFPRPILAPEPFDPLALLSAEQCELWRAAEVAEFQTRDLELAEAAWNGLAQQRLPEPAAVLVEFNRTLVLSERRREAESNEILAALLEAPVAARSQAGIPVAHLAGLRILKSGEARKSDLAKAISVQIEHPSAVTPFFLRVGAESRHEQMFRAAAAVWSNHELARRLFEKRLQNDSDTQLVQLDGQGWRSFAMGTNLVFRSSENLAGLTRELAEALRTPRYLLVTNAAGMAPPSATLFAQASEGGLTVQAWLADPAGLYAIQRQRAWLFGGILAASALVAWLGIAQLQRNYRRQQRLNELKSNFVSSVSHELRAPLASMRLMSESLQSGRVRDPEKQREYFDFLVQECRRLSGLIENVLDFSRIEQNKRAYRFEPGSLRAVCEGALRTMSASARENGIALEFNGPEGDASGEMDGAALQQALVNLLDNAIKHSPHNGTVRLGLKIAGERAEFSVRDDGCGIPAAEHKRIFERFYRLGSELRRETQGAGIGLSIVKHAVEAHGGQVLVESEPGKGATFTMQVPLKRKAAE